MCVFCWDCLPKGKEFLLSNKNALQKKRHHNFYVLNFILIFLVHFEKRSKETLINASKGKNIPYGKYILDKCKYSCIYFSFFTKHTSMLLFFAFAIHAFTIEEDAYIKDHFCVYLQTNHKMQMYPVHQMTIA